ncbi:HAD family hydrolase [Brucella anthropi]|uniref:HAD family hydrolase n=1 Tax=Brucella anthropi TaxID=529 RepID=UPI00244A08C3|nr:HAD family hydrolase [Brucella anthropi]MDG9793518.1 HAD hydrolase-like protein [Brucella anthropi]MDH0583340.1 HAD hydrolase-like protein [Brucella anthropi]MDH0819895.1 HAD hydrolase-like protein [Brucella anthropi]MDH2086685.1 HAD hydrolase-like protein [Brucella anthropi]
MALMSLHYQALGSAVQQNRRKNAQLLVLVDADNTLWDTDGVFANAQIKLLGSIENITGMKGSTNDQLNFVRQVDQAIAAQHHLGLRYPPRLLIDALIFVLYGESIESAAKKAWREGAKSGLDRETVKIIESVFLRDIASQPSLLPGVRKGLATLSAMNARTIVLTEGSRRRIARSIEYHELGGLVERIFEAPKSAKMFERVERYANSDRPVYIVGDQLTRDIKPANDAGLKTVYVPSKFQPAWERQGKIEPWRLANRFDEAIKQIQDDQ